MLINKLNSISFKGVTIENGGLEYVKQEGGQEAVNKLRFAEYEYVNSKWNLNVGKDGYSLKSPSTRKTYSGPFSVKKLFKTGARREDSTTIVVRMDKNNRTRFKVHLPEVKDVYKIYKSFKNSKGIDKMLLLLSILDKHV